MGHKTDQGVESVWVKVNGLNIHTQVLLNESQRASMSVVLIHGLAVSSRYTIPTAIALSPFANIYAPDLPGVGESEMPSHIPDLDELSHSLAAWAAEIGLKPAVYVGNSFGCQVIARFASSYPEMVERAVLIAPTIDRRARTFWRQFARFILNIPREPLSLISIASRDYLKAGLVRTYRTLQHALEDRIEQVLPTLKTETMIVRGGRDPIVPQDWVEHLATTLPHGQLVTIPRASHAVYYDAAEELAGAIMDFCSPNRERSRKEIKGLSNNP